MLAPCIAAERQEKYSGVEDNVPFREELGGNSCIYSGLLLFTPKKTKTERDARCAEKCE